MTKDKIISELINSNPSDVQSLFIVFYNKEAGVRYSYAYKYSACLTLE